MRSILLFLALIAAWPIAGRAQVFGGGLSPTNPSATGSYLLNGANGLTFVPTTQYREGVFVGPRAGASMPNNAGSFGLVGIGADSFRYLTAPGSESVAIGPYTGEFATNAYAMTLVGEHVMGFDNAPYTTAMGNDVMRDAMGMGTNGPATMFGAGIFADGASNGPLTIFGALSLPGSAGGLTVSGTLTTGDILHVLVSTTSASTVGLPQTVNYTIQAGDTLASVATSLANLVGSLTVTATYQDGVNSITENGVQLGTVPTIPGSFKLHFPGSSTMGWKILMTPSCTGACTEMMTYIPAFSGTDDTIIGAKNFTSGMNTTTAGLVAVGEYIGNLSINGGGTNSTIIGWNAGANITTDTNDVIVGALSGGESGGGYNTLVGWSAGSGMGVGGLNNAIFGESAFSSACITTGSNNLELGADACVPSPTASGQVSIQNAIIITGATQRGPGTPTGNVGIGLTNPATSLVVNGGLSGKRTTVANTNYTALSTDNLIAFTSLTASRILTIPCGSLGTAANPQYFVVKDESGSAGTFPIALSATIDGATNKTISTPYGATRLYANGSACFTW